MIGILNCSFFLINSVAFNFNDCYIFKGNSIFLQSNIEARIKEKTGPWNFPNERALEIHHWIMNIENVYNMSFGWSPPIYIDMYTIIIL